MRKHIFLILVLFFQFVSATTLTSFEEAQKLALATNKFIVVDFYADWCGPCKKMDVSSWSDEEVKLILDNYIFVKINIDSNRELVTKYNIKSIPNIFIVDGNGKELDSFSGYKDSRQLKKELEKFAVTNEFLSADLINYYKNKNFNSALRVSLKYLDYSLLVEQEIKNEILYVSKNYFYEAKKELSNKNDNFIEYKQKLDLIEMYYYAYENKFDKVDKKLKVFKEIDIKEGNIEFFYFLEYLTAKSLNKGNFKEIETKVKQIEGFDYFIKKADIILSKF